jgi:phage gpG-like protein
MSVQRTGKPLLQQLVEFRRLIRDLPAYVGTEAVRFFQDSFTRQFFIDTGFTKWEPRKPNAKRNTRGILMDTGALRRSIRIVSKGRNYVIVGATQPYAQAHNEGVDATVNIKAHSRRISAITKVFNIKTKRGRKVRVNTGSLAHVKAHTRKMKLEKRQFMGESAFFNKRILMQIEHRIKQIMLH